MVWVCVLHLLLFASIVTSQSETNVSGNEKSVSSMKALQAIGAKVGGGPKQSANDPWAVSVNVPASACRGIFPAIASLEPKPTKNTQPAIRSERLRSENFIRTPSFPLRRAIELRRLIRASSDEDAS